MAKTPPPVIPRNVITTSTTPDQSPAGARSRAQSGAVQLRDFDSAGRAWEEQYGWMRTRDADHQEWLTRLQYFRARSISFFIDHPLMPGSGLPIGGDGRENLVKTAQMDADTSGDGVADDWSATGDTGQVSFSIV